MSVRIMRKLTHNPSFRGSSRGSDPGLWYCPEWFKCETLPEYTRWRVTGDLASLFGLHMLMHTEAHFHTGTHTNNTHVLKGPENNEKSPANRANSLKW